MKKIFLTVAAAIFLASCANQSNESNTPKADAKTEPVNCITTYSAEHTVIGFGAFKTTAKKEVKGNFKKFSIENISEGSTHEEIFQKATFTIPIFELETNDAGRNQRIRDEFFNKMNDTEFITGKVIAFEKDSSKIKINLTMNGISNEEVFSYTINNDSIMINGSIDVLNYSASEALASLNKACESLHKGDDGISKTWSDVNIYINSVLTEVCK